MISPLKLMERLRLSGPLVAFFKAVCVYVAVSMGAEGGVPSLVAAAAKCAPIVCLLVIVLAHRANIPTDSKQSTEWRRYGARVALGLTLSSAGDALLVWPTQLVAGMGAFAAAHVAYIAAFGWRPLAPLAAPPLLAGAGGFLWAVRAEGALRVLVPLYALLLVTMAWRAVARASQRAAPPGAPSAAAGAALFVVSDAALGYSMFAAPLPHSQVIVMSTYYLAQLGIALSALQGGGARGAAGGGARGAAGGGARGVAGDSAPPPAPAPSPVSAK